MKYDFRKLVHIATVARSGSFSGAAKELHITQPALSRNIAAVERELGIKIFERGRHGASLTALGEQVVAGIEDLIRRADNLEDSLKLYAQGKAGPVHFGIGPMLSSLVLPSMTAELLRDHPDVQIRAVIKSAPDLMTELHADRVELFFAGIEQVERHRDLVVQPLASVPIRALVRAGHPLATKRAVSQADIGGYPILGGLGIPVDLYGSGQLACDNYHILHDTVLNTDGIWLSSPYLVEGDIAAGRLCVLPVKAKQFISTTTIGAVYRAGFTLSPMALRVLAYIESFLADRSVESKSAQAS